MDFSLENILDKTCRTSDLYIMSIEIFLYVLPLPTVYRKYIYTYLIYLQISGIIIMQTNDSHIAEK